MVPQWISRPSVEDVRQAFDRAKREFHANPRIPHYEEHLARTVLALFEPETVTTAAELDALRVEVGILQTTLREVLAEGEAHKRMHADACDEIGKLAATVERLTEDRRELQAANAALVDALYVDPS